MSKTFSHRSRIDHTVPAASKLDKKDQKILSVLSNDARETFSHIAQKVMVSRDGVRYRMSRLEDQGVLRGYVPNINYSALGYLVFHIFVQIEERPDDVEQKMYNDIAANPNVMAITEYSDKWDLRITAIARSIHSFNQIYMEIITKYASAINDTEILINTDLISSAPLPLHTAKLADMEKQRVVLNKNQLSYDAPEIQIDDMDRQILLDLADNGRMSYIDIAQNKNVSPDTIKYRLKQLIANGIIVRFEPIICYTVLGYNYYTLFLKLRSFTQETESRFKEYVSKNALILTAHKTLGEYNLLIQLASPSQKVYHKTIQALRAEFIEEIKDYDLLMGFKEWYYNPIPDCIFKEIKK